MKAVQAAVGLVRTAETLILTATRDGVIERAVKIRETTQLHLAVGIVSLTTEVREAAESAHQPVIVIKIETAREKRTATAAGIDTVIVRRTEIGTAIVKEKETAIGIDTAEMTRTEIGIAGRTGTWVEVRQLL